MSPSIPPPLPLSPLDAWLHRHKVWVIAGFACLAAAGCLIFFGVIFLGVTGMMRASVPFKMAMEAARTDVRVTEELGIPVQDGWLLNGTLNYSDDEGRANIMIPVSGPHGSGLVHVVATKSVGTWVICRLTFEGDDSEQEIDLATKAYEAL